MRKKEKTIAIRRGIYIQEINLPNITPIPKELYAPKALNKSHW